MALITADAIEDDEHVGKAYDLGGPDALSFGEVTRMLYRAEGKPVKIFSIPMELAKTGIRMVGPISVIPIGIDQTRALEMSNVIEHNNIDAIRLDELDLLSLSDYLRSGAPHRGRCRESRAYVRVVHLFALTLPTVP